MKNIKTIITIIIVSLSIAVAVISVQKYRETAINKNIEKISLSHSEFYGADENDLSRFPRYTVENGDVFYKYKADNAQNGTLKKTELKISDYTPYIIKLTLKNNSDYNVENTHICGLYSSDAVITEVNEGTYWFGHYVSSHSQEAFEALVWVKKDLTQSQVDEISKTLEFDCEILVDCSSGNEYNTKTVTLKCLPE